MTEPSSSIEIVLFSAQTDSCWKTSFSYFSFFAKSIPKSFLQKWNEPYIRRSFGVAMVPLLKNHWRTTFYYFTEQFFAENIQEKGYLMHFRSGNNIIQGFLWSYQGSSTKEPFENFWVLKNELTISPPPTRPPMYFTSSVRYPSRAYCTDQPGKNRMMLQRTEMKASG